MSPLQRIQTPMKVLAAVGLLVLSSLMTFPVFAEGGDRVVTIGSADFPESQLIATIYAKALQAKGVKTETKLSIGSREVYMPALRDGSIDLIPEYSGSILTYLDRNAKPQNAQEVNDALKKALPAGISMLTPSPAQDADTLVVTSATATKYGLKAIPDLKDVAANLVVGASPEWRGRWEGMVGLKEVYGLTFKSFRPLDVTGPLTLSALLHGQIDVANLTSTNPALARNKLVSLEDPKNLFPAQNIVPIFATQKIDEKVSAILDAVSAAMTTEDLVEMNGRLANHDDIGAIAADWLTAHKLN
jgi:osmoprotectant transport system substrate-binding protein